MNDTRIVAVTMPKWGLSMQLGKIIGWIVAEGDDVSVGDEVVLFGQQGGETVLAWEWAERLDTIAYEIVCGIPIDRVPRRYVG